MAAGLTLQAVALGWMATTASIHQSYSTMIVPFLLAGAGMSLVFAPAANAVLSSVKAHQAGQASGATNAIRELGGVLGIAVLATVFTSHGSYASPQAFVQGLQPALWVGVAVLGAGALLAAALPFSTRADAAAQLDTVPATASASSAMASATTGTHPRQRVPASERRDALIEAAVHEFALGGLHGTPVDRIARRVGVAQPYVFSLFGSKKELFLAAVERCFDLVKETFTRVAAEYDPSIAVEDADVLLAMGHSYVELLHSHRDYLMLQHQAYAACNDPEIRDSVRALYAGLVTHVERIAAEAAQRSGSPCRRPSRSTSSSATECG